MAFIGLQTDGYISPFPLLPNRECLAQIAPNVSSFPPPPSRASHCSSRRYRPLRCCHHDCTRRKVSPTYVPLVCTCERSYRANPRRSEHDCHVDGNGESYHEGNVKPGTQVSPAPHSQPSPPSHSPLRCHVSTHRWRFTTKRPQSAPPLRRSRPPPALHLRTTTIALTTAT